MKSSFYIYEKVQKKNNKLQKFYLMNFICRIEIKLLSLQKIIFIMTDFKSPYGFYIFSITGQSKLFYKLGFASINKERSISTRIGEWKNKLYRSPYADDYTINAIYVFDGVYKLSNDKYLILGNKNSYYQRRDGDIRELLSDMGITREKQINIRLDESVDESFTEEGIRFVDSNISNNDIVSIMNEIVQKIKDGKVDGKYYHILSRQEYESFVKDINDTNSLIYYSTERFCQYLSIYGDNVVLLDFIELLRSELTERDLTNKITYDDIFVKMIKDQFMTERTSRMCIDTDRRIHNLYRSKCKSIITDIENWINQKIYNGESSLF